MTGTVDVLGTDLFREHHRSIAAELDEISRALTMVRARAGHWRDAGPTLRRLLILLEHDVERLADEEERLFYDPLARARGLTPALAECYREHSYLRLGVEKLRHDLARATAASRSAGGATDQLLFDDCDALIRLVRIHMARVDEVLFPAAEQALTREQLKAAGDASELVEHVEA